ncbi:YbfB/YjiJ family MFS transporter [Amycolatopsis anabasis]|uniref:YbfB/YjiJ family MFS transporter n=1 Tax=Amycolatopsis anabasis TaxID=1840409 RepID=UPI00131C8B00|nr:YbfB/YjiJ family MFS transporter [Amycolatopsis anabasis]
MIRPMAVAFGLSTGPVVGLGFARFAYALVLPAMRDELGWSFGTAGQQNTANAVGHLAGAVIAAPIARRIGERRAFLGGLVVTALALLGTAALSDTLGLLVLRVISGTGGSVCFVVGGGLTSRAGLGLSGRRATVLLGVYFAGSGAGVVLSGLVVPVVEAAWGWRAAWLLMGGLGLLVLFAAVPAARAVPPEEKPAATRARRGWPVGRLAALLAAYGLFGTGYIAYMTFIVAYLKQAGAGAGEVTAFWTVLGLAAVAGGFLWGAVLSSVNGGVGTALVLVVLAAGALVPLLSTGAVAAFCSAALFGVAFLNVMTAVTTTARNLLPPARWTPAIAGLTVAFALGQCVGPFVSGLVSDGPGGIKAGLALGFALIVLAALVALTQPRRTA